MWRLNTIFLILSVISWIPGDIKGQTDGDVRLKDGDTQYQGRVEIYHNGEWRRVCDDWWGINDAKVTCRQLGFEDAHTAYKGHSPRGTGSFWLSGLNCTGTEEGLSNCTSDGWGSISFSCNITEYDDPGVICKSPGDGAVRLVKLSRTFFSRVEVYYAGEWGRLCSWGWGRGEADVICRQLGLDSSYGVGPRRGTGKYWISGLDCAGTESNITQCTHDGVGKVNAANCVQNNTNDAGVLCFGANVGDIRLIGYSQYFGRVEMALAGDWWRVCDDSWTINEASVACRQLGFGRALQYWRGWTPKGTSNFVVDQLNCAGTEDRLLACSSGSLALADIFDCSANNTNDPGVACEAPDDGQLRLMDGNGNNSGRVEIKFAGVWWRVCDDGWGSNEATVVCRQLGYSGYGRSVRGWSPSGSGSFWLGYVYCQGTESNLTYCSHSTIGVYDTHYCNSSSYNDAGVYCLEYLTDVTSPNETTDETITTTESSLVTTTVAGGPSCYSCSDTYPCTGSQSIWYSYSSYVTCSYGYVCYTTASAYGSYTPFNSFYNIAYNYSRGCISRSQCTSQELQGSTCTGSGASKVCKHCCTSNYCNSGRLDTSQSSVNTNNKGSGTRSAWFNFLCVLLLFVFARN